MHKDPRLVQHKRHKNLKAGFQNNKYYSLKTKTTQNVYNYNSNAKLLSHNNKTWGGGGVGFRKL